MTPTSEIISATLRLPIEARQALASQPGPGWWVTPTGESWFQVLPAAYESDLAGGFSWLPSNDTAWMEAAAGERMQPSWHAGRWYIEAGSGNGVASAESAPICALRRWGVWP